jgi:hypothetical protein
VASKTRRARMKNHIRQTQGTSRISNTDADSGIQLKAASPVTKGTTRQQITLERIERARQTIKELRHVALIAVPILILLIIVGLVLR